VEFSISATTRPPRSGEQEGVDYHFRDEPAFRRMISEGELLEWAEVHGNLYGTPRANLELARSRSHYLLLDIDVQGSRQVKSSVPDAVSIFVLPPSGRELARRLIGRGSEDRAVQRRRLLAARAELSAALEFDYVLVNDDLAASVASVERILAVESLRTARIADLEERVQRLIAGVDEVLEARD
jgi:guanylate kinase